MQKDQAVIENLGRLAVQAELLAINPKLTPVERAYQLNLARVYRDAQWEEMEAREAVA